MNKNFIFHFRPRKVPAAALRFTFTWGLGGAAVLMVFLQFLTGLLLNFNYEPFPVQAYLSVQHIQTELFFGQLIRNMHHWTGHFLVVVVCLHLVRVFFSGSYLSSRRLNWQIGLTLFLLVLMANFTGYLLPWDQLAYWAVTIATSMLAYIPAVGEMFQELLRGGAEVTGTTLRTFHTIHTTVLPLSFLFCMSYHFWRIRKAGGIKIDNQGKQEMLPAFPELLVRELAAAAVILCFLLLFSMQFDAPLTDMAHPDLTPDTVKAPWYFLWLQELLLHFHPVFAMCILPLSFAVFLMLVPFLRQKGENPSRVVQVLFVSFFLVLTGLTVTGIWFRGAGMALIWPW